jgi:hypothetical protein
MVMHVCPPCIHKQDHSFASTCGSQVGWGPVITVANSVDLNGKFSDQESAHSGTASRELMVNILNICCCSESPGYVK